jgi:hypothetical protein
MSAPAPTAAPQPYALGLPAGHDLWLVYAVDASTQLVATIYVGTEDDVQCWAPKGALIERRDALDLCGLAHRRSHAECRQRIAEIESDLTRRQRALAQARQRLDELENPDSGTAGRAPPVRKRPRSNSVNGPPPALGTMGPPPTPTPMSAHAQAVAAAEMAARATNLTNGQ